MVLAMLSLSLSLRPSTLSFGYRRPPSIRRLGLLPPQTLYP